MCRGQVAKLLYLRNSTFLHEQPCRFPDNALRFSLRASGPVDEKSDDEGIIDSDWIVVWCHCPGGTISGR